MTPTPTNAHQFALMLQSGMPPVDAIPYFFAPETEPSVLAEALKGWMRSAAVQHAVRTLQGNDWQAMTLDERIRLAIDKHYAELAYFLYSHNYSTLTGGDRAKADICRQSLEAKIAGTAGKLGPIEAFWNDVKTGKVTLKGLPA